LTKQNQSLCERLLSGFLNPYFLSFLKRPSEEHQENLRSFFTLNKRPFGNGENITKESIKVNPNLAMYMMFKVKPTPSKEVKNEH
jgi:hypothetical protein